MPPDPPENIISDLCGCGHWACVAPTLPAEQLVKAAIHHLRRAIPRWRQIARLDVRDRYPSPSRLYFAAVEAEQLLTAAAVSQGIAPPDTERPPAHPDDYEAGIFRRIAAERKRQDSLYPFPQPREQYLAITGSEFGEVSHEEKWPDDPKHHAQLIVELTQLAAVCVAFIHALETVYPAASDDQHIPPAEQPNDHQ